MVTNHPKDNYLKIMLRKLTHQAKNIKIKEIKTFRYMEKIIELLFLQTVTNRFKNKKQNVNKIVLIIICLN